jgi:hypothetical protein
MRFDGRTWEPLPLPEGEIGYLATWGTSNGDIYCVGEYSIQRFDGTEWHRIQRPARVRDIWGSNDGEIFVVGGNDRLYHYDGTDWSVDSLMVNHSWGDPWWEVAGGTPEDLYITGSSGWLGHFDGDGWTAERVDSTRDFSRSWKAPDGPLFMVSRDSLFAYDGAQLSFVDMGTPQSVSTVWGQSASEIYCAVRGNYPYQSVLRYDGNAWTNAAVLQGEINVVWGDRSSNRLLAAGDGVVWEADGAAVRPSLGLEPYRNRFYDLWGSNDDGVFVIGTAAHRYFEGKWIDLKKEDLTTNDALSIWGRSGRELYAVGGPMILQYDGESWTWVSGGGQFYLTAVAGNTSEVFAVGYRGAIVRYDGHSWSPMESGTTSELLAVYAWDGGAFAVGEAGVMLRYNGHEWRPYPSPVGWTMYDIYGFGSDDVFAVGRSSTEICHFDGREWKPILIGYSVGYAMSIWGTSNRNLFIGQGDGNVLHFDGRAWSSLPRVTTGRAFAVWGTSKDEIISATDGGVIRYTR